MEKSKKNILFLFLLLFSFSFVSFAQIKDVPVVILFDKEYYKYEVRHKETLYSICKKFNVTEAEILTMNPFIVNGLKADQTLIIPVKMSKNSNVKEILVTKDNEKKNTAKSRKKKSANNTVIKPRITLILPFNQGGDAGTNEKYIEFYEGLLLAVDSLKSLGFSFEVQALESGTDIDAINQAITTGKLKETDYCIGGVTPEQISILSKWAKKNQKMLIVPFSSRVLELDSNPYIIQTITPHNYMYDRLVDYLAGQLEHSNIIFLKAGVDNSDVQSKLIPQLKSKLSKKGLSFSEIDNDEDLVALNKALKENMVNSIIPTSLPMNETTQLVSRLSAFLVAHPEMKVSVYGHPDWQAMNKGYQKRLYELDSYIYSNFYADFQQQDVRNFQIQYTQNFGKSLLNTYPKYGMMGYDLAAYFIPRMVLEKSDNMEKTPSISPLQNDFHFSTKTRTGGSYNKVFYLIHYTRKNTVELIPLK